MNRSFQAITTCDLRSLFPVSWTGDGLVSSRLCSMAGTSGMCEKPCIESRGALELGSHVPENSCWPFEVGISLRTQGQLLLSICPQRPESARGMARGVGGLVLSAAFLLESLVPSTQTRPHLAVALPSCPGTVGPSPPTSLQPIKADARAKRGARSPRSSADPQQAAVPNLPPRPQIAGTQRQSPMYRH